MKKVRNALTYGNVVATIALFLALSGGVVFAASKLGKNAVKSKNIATHAVKNRNLAKSSVKAGNLAANAVTTAKIKAGAVTGGKVEAASLGRTNLAPGTLAGLQVLDVSAASVPGLNVETEETGGTAVPLSGTASFTPVTGKSYTLLAELRGNPVDANGGEPGGCFAGVTILDNGAPITGTGISVTAGATPPFNFQPIGTEATAIGLQAAGQPQAISALSFGSPNCNGTTASLRIVVVENG